MISGSVGFNLPSESESYCAFLIRDQAGSAMVSCDSDSLAHLAPDLILDVELSGKIVRIELEELLESLHITSEQMIDYAILMGCDYNKHSKTNKLGPVNALKYIQQYGHIEDIPIIFLTKNVCCILVVENCFSLTLSRLSYTLKHLMRTKSMNGRPIGN